MAVFKNILSTMRLQRWYINCFVIVGACIAVYPNVATLKLQWPALTLVLLATCLISSANYAINEVFDAESDGHHTGKKGRAVASGAVSKISVLLLALGLYALGFLLYAKSGQSGLVLIGGLLILSGMCYNVPPLRLKDRAFFDFSSEALNNPLRLALGWYSVQSATIPASLLLSIWFFATMLMSAKRLVEFRATDNHAQLLLYRKSFAGYSEKLLGLAFLGSVSGFMFMFGALAIRHNTNLILLFPLILSWILWFGAITHEPHSFINEPDNPFSHKKFLVFSIVVCAIALITTGYTGWHLPI